MSPANLSALAAALVIAGLAVGAFWPAQTTVESPAELAEPATPYGAGAMGEAAEKLFRLARSEAAQGNIESAIEAMQWAANEMAKQRQTNFELWDDLAELYCVQAKREKDPARARASRAIAMTLLKEARCGATYYDKIGAACFMDDTALPNPDMTPLCYTVLCTDGPKRPVPATDTTDLLATGLRQRSIDESGRPQEPRIGKVRYPNDDASEPKDDRTDAERELQARRLKVGERPINEYAAADVVYDTHFKEDVANLDQIEASCTGPAQRK